LSSAATRRTTPFDALIVGYYEGNRLLYAAKVRNGFVPQLRRDVATKFKGLQIDTCPFANLRERNGRNGR
jgi:ATP-dependent DNA ligase